MEKIPNDKNHTFQELLSEASNRYGEEAEFAYPTKDKKFAMLTLNEAVHICGQHMVDADESQLWKTLDQFHVLAEKIKERGDDMSNAARNIGSQALNKYRSE